MKRRNLLFASSGIALAPLLMQASKTIAATPISTGELVTLADNLKGYYIHPAGTGTFPAVVVIMEAFGLNDYVKSICDRLAQAGYAALAPDFYHGEAFAYTDTNGAVGKLKSLNDETVMGEFGKGLEFLAKRTEVKPNVVGTIAFVWAVGLFILPMRFMRLISKGLFRFMGLLFPPIQIRWSAKIYSIRLRQCRLQSC